MTISDRQFRRMQRELRVAFLILALSLAGGLWLGYSERQDRIDSIARASAAVVLDRCVATEKIAVTLQDALRGQLELSTKRWKQGAISWEDYLFARRSLTQRIRELEPAETCPQTAARIRAAAQ